MKESKVLLVSLICILATSMFAENADSIRLVSLEQSLQKEIRARERLKSELLDQTRTIAEQSRLIDSLCSVTEQNKKDIMATTEQLGIKMNETKESLGTKADSSDVKSKTIWGVTFLLILLILGCSVYYLLIKRIAKGKTDIDALQQKAEKLNEEILDKFSAEMDEMQKISSSLDALSKTATETNSRNTGEPDHSLIITLADRITFMEMTLSKMDPKVKGYKQLAKSISQMKDNLLANGYELVDMLGKPYNDGMKVTASFIEDEELEAGQQIITGIIKPQINYKGIMIQAAQIKVSQNI